MLPARDSTKKIRQVDILIERPATTALRWTVLVLSVGALWVLTPLWAPLLLAAFAAVVAAPLHERFAKRFMGRNGAAALLTVALVVVLLIPLLVLVLSASLALTELSGQLRGSSGPGELWRRLSSVTGAAPTSGMQGLLDFARSHGGSAFRAAGSLFGAVSTVVVALFVFVYGFHTLLIDGRRAYGWALGHSPIRRAHLHRLGEAFSESARGLLIGVGLTALVQGSVATVGYVVLGVPQALALGLLTCMAALIPSFGTGLIWAPVAVGLFVAGRSAAGGVLVGIGVFVSVVDNFIRPVLSKYGKLEMSTFLLLVAMLGGIVAFGGFGLLLGPLLVRLSIEAWEIFHDAKLDAAS